ncbi:unnamed protein product, partial [Musa acuminata subsp. malaccensis]
MELRCAAQSFVLFLSFTLLLASTRADPHPLQDSCVADFGATGVVVNGFPCKPASNVTSDDFFFAGLSNEGNTSNIFGSSVTPANVLSFAGLNTLGVSMNRVDVAPGGVNPPHSHPRATRAHHPPRGSTAGGVRQHQQPVLLQGLESRRDVRGAQGPHSLPIQRRNEEGARHHHLRQPAPGGSDRLHYPVRIDAGDSRRCAGQSFSGGSEGCHRHKVQV